MNIDDKLFQINKTIKEIKSISEKLNNDNKFESKIDELNKEVLRLKKGISESVYDLEEFLKEENAKS